MAEQLGEYLRAEQLDSPGTTEIWAIHSARHGDVLGQIRWFGRWRQYVFYPVDGALFNAQCLRDIASFLADRYAHWYRARREAGRVAVAPSNLGERE